MKGKMCFLLYYPLIFYFKVIGLWVCETWNLFALLFPWVLRSKFLNHCQQYYTNKNCKGLKWDRLCILKILITCVVPHILLTAVHWFIVLGAHLFHQLFNFLSRFESCGFEFWEKRKPFKLYRDHKQVS